MRLLSIFILTILSVCVQSQSKSSNELIAEGAAKMRVKPDIAIFTLTIEKNDSIEKNSIRNLNTGIGELVNALNKIGFANKSIKISDYDISSSTDIEDKKSYTATNILKIEFGIDNKLIDAFYNEIQRAGIQDLDVAFDALVSDSLEKVSRLRLVQLAIEDAKTNANNISKALVIKLIRIKQVRKYNEKVLEGNIVEIEKLMDVKIVGSTDVSFKTSFDKFLVDDVELEEKITIVYEISR